ncbi:helix-turn-helix transcriptional regulator [Streptomyces sp. NPDC088124]|uniref:helix-turn-helix domain-containing protein n=1 Tax=Streptomyces sp. NPDC088124 TaxID=3154654 RepID=UPI00341FC1E8
MALRLFAADLRARRKAAGLTIESVAQSLGVHSATVGRLEQAQTAPRRATVTHLLRLYGTRADEVDAVLDALGEALADGWWHPYRALLPDHLAGVIDLESAASLIRSYAPGVVPELLQTRGYARALLQLRYPRASENEIGERLDLLRARQEHALGRNEPVRLWVLMEEAVLTRPVGAEPAVMHEQLAALDGHTVRRDVVTVQVIPTLVGPHPLLLSGPVDILRYPHPQLADRLVVRGLHAEAATVSDDLGAVRTYQAAMDATAALALPPTTRLPLSEGSSQ